MSRQDDNKEHDSGKSDLDVFDDLHRRPSAGASTRERTMTGMPSPSLPPIPPASPSGRPMIPPHAPTPRKSSRPPGPAASRGRGNTIPPPAAPYPTSRNTVPPASLRSSKPPPLPPTLRTSLPPLADVPGANGQRGSSPSATKGLGSGPGVVGTSASPSPTSGARSWPAATPAGIGSIRPQAGPPLPEMGSDWDDEEEKTTVYDKSTQDAAEVLLRGAPDIPPPPMSRPPAMVPSIAPPIPAFNAQRAVKAQRPVQAPTPAPAQSRVPLLLLGLAVLVLGAVLVLLVRPQKGSLIVTVAGPGNRPIDGVEVLVDGEVLCNTSPCAVRDLKAKTYLVQARAAGYQEAAAMALAIGGGQEAVHNISLVRAGGTGIRVSAEGNGLKLYVDGAELGPLPQELDDMAPGEHTVKIAGNDRYAPYEQRVTVQANKMEAIGPLKLKVLRGLALIQAGSGSDDARVVLESGRDRRTLPELPIRLDIPTDREHTLIATKRGFTAYREKLVFEDGQAEKTFTITMTKVEDAPEEEESAPAPTRGGTDRRPRAPVAAAAPSTATLNINSIPRSNVILDGRPLGATPKIGISVSPGKHTVVFVKDSERKSTTIEVSAGSTKTVAVRF